MNSYEVFYLVLATQWWRRELWHDTCTGRMSLTVIGMWHIMHSVLHSECRLNLFMSKFYHINDMPLCTWVDIFCVLTFSFAIVIWAGVIIIIANVCSLLYECFWRSSAVFCFPDFAVMASIPAPKFQFGGRTGQTVSTVVFQKKEAT